MNSVFPFYHYLLIEPQRHFQPVGGLGVEAYTRLSMWAQVTGKDRGFSNSVLCDYFSSLEHPVSQAQAHAVMEASENRGEDRCVL